MSAVKHAVHLTKTELYFIENYLHEKPTSEPELQRLLQEVNNTLVRVQRQEEGKL